MRVIGLAMIAFATLAFLNAHTSPTPPDILPALLGERLRLARFAPGSIQTFVDLPSSHPLVGLLGDISADKSRKWHADALFQEQDVVLIGQSFSVDIRPDCIVVFNQPGEIAITRRKTTLTTSESERIQREVKRTLDD